MPSLYRPSTDGLIPVSLIVITSHINSDVYLSLNSTVIPNHGYVAIDDIGSDDESALLCHTDRPKQPSGHSGGNWFAPDGTRLSYPDVPGFTRNRGPMVVRLQRTSGETPEGRRMGSIWL